MEQNKERCSPKERCSYRHCHIDLFKPFSIGNSGYDNKSINFHFISEHNM